MITVCIIENIYTFPRLWHFPLL